MSDTDRQTDRLMWTVLDLFQAEIYLLTGNNVINKNNSEINDNFRSRLMDIKQYNEPPNVFKQNCLSNSIMILNSLNLNII